MTVAAEVPRVNILLVDDEPANLIALEATLEPLGQNLVRAASGREALLATLRMDFAVILLDVQMPGMDGFETAELLRKRARTRDVPIIFLTAISTDREFVARGYNVGAVDYLVKPYDAANLASKVAVFVELAQKSAAVRAQRDALRQVNEREIAEIRRASDRRYSDLADSMPQIVWSADSEGRILHRNARWHEVAGEGAEFSDIVHPDDLATFLAGWETAVTRGEPWEAELRVGSARSGWAFHLVRAVPRRDAEGEISSWIGTSIDIDARVRADRALRMLAEASRRLGATLEEGEAELQAVLEVSLSAFGDAVLLQILGDGGPPRQVRAVSGSVSAELFDDPRFGLGPSTVSYTGRPELYFDVETDLADARSGRGAENLRFLAELGVGSYMCLPLVSRGRTIGAITFVLRAGGGRFSADDVTVGEDLARRIAAAIDNVRLHETTERRRLELEQANQSKDVFLATLSHELRTPLNAIVGWTDMMRAGQLSPDELTRAIETVDRNAHALSGLVADLLDVSRIVTGTLKLDSKLFTIASVVESAVEGARPQCAAKRVTLDVSLDRVGCVKGDPGRLRQVIGNLLSNAIKFTPSGGTVTVRVVGDGSVARVVVGDSGEGISPDFLPHVFERFRQAEKARARGLGLGLAIVKHLVEDHGGRVAAASDGLGKGSTFTVELPIAAPEEAAGDAEEGRASHPAPGAPELAGLHVLVVEDDPDGNELITTILERYGAKVTSVGTAAAALDVLAHEVPDVIVSDIGLPDVDGTELIKQVRDREDAGAVPAIALTAYASRQDAAKVIAAGFDAHVAKPVQPGTLGGAVARLVSSRRSVKSLPAA